MVEPDKSAASAAVEALPGSLESAEAGPSKPTTTSSKKRYEVDHEDLAFCKRVCISLLGSKACHGSVS